MLKKTGIPTKQDLLSVTPSMDRLKRGPVAIIECFEKIPCNPCYTACNQGAIKKFANINDLPEIDHEKCNGCGACISKCPGLAIIVIDYDYSEKDALVRIPWEMPWTPKIDEVINAVKRDGQVIGEAKVKKIQNLIGQDRTKIIWLLVNKKIALDLRSIKIKGDRKK